MLAKDEDDPPMIFGWNDLGLEEFWNKAVAYGQGNGAILPPAEFNTGNHVDGILTSALRRSIKSWFLGVVMA